MCVLVYMCRCVCISPSVHVGACAHFDVCMLLSVCSCVCVYVLVVDCLCMHLFWCMLIGAYMRVGACLMGYGHYDGKAFLCVCVHFSCVFRYFCDGACMLVHA